METIYSSEELLKDVIEIIQKSEHVVLDKIELEDTHDSTIYKSMVKMPLIDLQYRDVKWIIDSYSGIDAVKEYIAINCRDIDSAVFNYIYEIICNDAYLKRDKIVLILAHMEACIFQCLDAVRESNGIVKNIKKLAADNHKVTWINYRRIYLIGISKVLYANTDNFKEEIDKSLPFRNNILHQGIVGYSDDEIENLYYVLLCFFSRLTECKKGFDLEKKMKEVDEKRRNIGCTKDY